MPRLPTVTFCLDLNWKQRDAVLWTGCLAAHTVLLFEGGVGGKPKSHWPAHAEDEHLSDFARVD